MYVCIIYVYVYICMYYREKEREAEKINFSEELQLEFEKPSIKNSLMALFISPGFTWLTQQIL